MGYILIRGKVRGKIMEGGKVISYLNIKRMSIIGRGYSRFKDGRESLVFWRS